MSMHRQFERGSTSASHRSISLTRSSVLAANAIKTSIATAVTSQTYNGAALNGSSVTNNIATPSPSGQVKVAQYPIAVASSSAGSYVASSLITFTGIYGGVSVVRTATVVGTGGNATFIADGPLDSCSSITVAAQANTSGAWTFGWDDIACPGPDSLPTPFRWIAATSTGNAKITCGDGNIDTVTGLTATYPPLFQEVRRVWFSDAATTLTTLRLSM